MSTLKAGERYTVLEMSKNDGSLNTYLRQAEFSSANEKKKNVFHIIPPPCFLEIEDVAFSHNSAVPLPILLGKKSDQDTSAGGEMHWEDPELGDLFKKCHPEAYNQFCTGTTDDGPVWGAGKITMAAIAVIYLFMENNPSYRCVIAGHADTSGKDDYNFIVSELRAKSILYLLTGKKDEWVSLCESKHTPQDYKMIMNHYSLIHGLNCFFDSIDDTESKDTESMIVSFKGSYENLFGVKLPSNGKLDHETWEAIYDLYENEIAMLLGSKPTDLGSFRQKVKFVDDKHQFVGCGERIPIDEPERDNHRSTANRRVEILFFHQTQLPDLSAHLPGGKITSGKGKRIDSGVYSPGYGPFQVIEPVWWEAGVCTTSSGSRKFDVRELERDLDYLPDNPADQDYQFEINSSREQNEELLYESPGKTKGMWSKAGERNTILI